MMDAKINYIYLADTVLSDDEGMIGVKRKRKKKKQNKLLLNCQLVHYYLILTKTDATLSLLTIFDYCCIFVLLFLMISRVSVC